MENNNINNNNNVFLYTDSESKQNYRSYNIDENQINDRYMNLSQKMEGNDIDKKEEKYQQYYNSRKKCIFENNYGKKISLFTQSNQDTSNKSKSKSKINLVQDKIIYDENVYITENDEEKDLTVEQYREYIKKKYEDDPLYFEAMDEENNKYHYRHCFCFFCHYPAFVYKNVVTCISKCYNMKIRTDEFDDNYTLTNFLDDHYYFYTDHYECGGNIIPMFIDERNKEPYFICDVCDGKVLEKIGIIL